MTRITSTWLADDRLQRIFDLLLQKGHQAFLVGGCVRNALLGVEVSDLDMTTDATPQRVMDLAKKAGLKVVPTGFEHGTVTVICDGLPVEITTFRRDVETDGRRAVVAFSTTVEDDAHRRDFTMNALYADRSGGVHDPVNGLKDLTARRVRFIDDAQTRIREDYLRSLRFFRFHAWFGDTHAGIDPDGLAACAANLAGLETLSAERIGAEMLKLLAAPDPAPALAAMEASGVLNCLLPGADASKVGLLVHLEAGISADPLRRLVMLGGDETARRLRLSRKQATRLLDLRDGIGTVAPPSELAYRHGSELARDIILLRAAMFETPLPAGLESDLERGARACFPMEARDLMPEFTGAGLGAELKRLEAVWIASEFQLSKEELLT